MRHHHSPRFEPLEARNLQSKVHVAAAHPAAAAAAAPVAIVGTLTVSKTGKTSVMNGDGSWTTSVPVSGDLGAVGEVKGDWNQTVDAYGDYEAPDVLRLSNAKGTVYLVFNSQSAGPMQKVGTGTIEKEHAQKLYSGTGAYAKATESGTIEVVSNSAQTVVKSLTLDSQSS